MLKIFVFISSAIFCMSLDRALSAAHLSLEDSGASEERDQFNPEPSDHRFFNLRGLEPSFQPSLEKASAVRALVYLIARSQKDLSIDEISALRGKEWNQSKTIERFSIAASYLVCLPADPFSATNEANAHFSTLFEEILTAPKYGKGDPRHFYETLFFNNMKFRELATAIKVMDADNIAVKGDPKDLVLVFAEPEPMSSQQLWKIRKISRNSYEPISAIVLNHEEAGTFYDVLLKEGDQEAYLKANMSEATIKPISEINAERKVAPFAVWYKRLPKHPSSCCSLQ